VYKNITKLKKRPGPNKGCTATDETACIYRVITRIFKGNARIKKKHLLFNAWLKQEDRMDNMRTFYSETPKDETILVA
jgi:hypothetical protein